VKNNQSIDERVRTIVEKVRPFIKMHGGDVEFVGIEDDKVVLAIKGSCVGCTLADLTYNEMIGGIIKADIPGIEGIILRKG
jgi:Fe-S cluster biogenesis protein NfuA